jgi:hypothetical protein
MNRRIVASLSLFAALGLTVMGLVSCDPDGKKQCAWFIEYDANRPDRLALEGYVPVCAKNLKMNKQDCRFDIPADKGVEYYNKYFRYVDVKVTSVALPRIIVSIKTCNKDENK